MISGFVGVEDKKKINQLQTKEIYHPVLRT